MRLSLKRRKVIKKHGNTGNKNAYKGADGHLHIRCPKSLLVDIKEASMSEGITASAWTLKAIMLGLLKRRIKAK